MSNLAIGIDIGGTGIKAAVVDLDTGTLATERRRLLTPQPALPKAVAKTVARLFEQEELRAPQLVGAGFPAVVKDGVALTAANVDKSWIGTNVAETIGAAIGRTVTAFNDADAAGLAELRFGAGKDVRGMVAMITLGTGIGCALFLNGTLVPNTELGHIQIRGKDAERRAAASVRERKKLTWKEWSGRVEEYLNALDALIWPDLIIIGGGVSATPEKFIPRLQCRPKVVAATLGNDAGIIGAALHAAEAGTQ